MRYRVLLPVLALCVPTVVAVADRSPYLHEPSQVGEASWYGPGFHGRVTANGETYDMYGLTAAHQHLPFGTSVRVVRLDTGISVVVRINDRGPYIGARVVDLSFAAAQRLGMLDPGLAPVRLDIVETASLPQARADRPES